MRTDRRRLRQYIAGQEDAYLAGMVTQLRRSRGMLFTPAGLDAWLCSLLGIYRAEIARRSAADAAARGIAA